MRNRVAWHFRQLESAQTRVLDARFVTEVVRSESAKAGFVYSPVTDHRGPVNQHKAATR